MFARKLLIAAAALLMTGVFASQAKADPITGSFGIIGINPAMLDGSNNVTNNLNNAAAFHFGALQVFGGSGDFAPVVDGSLLTSSSNLTLNNLLGYNWTSSFGSFQAAPITVGGTTYNSYASPVQNGAQGSSLTVFEYGTFTPGGILSSFGPNSLLETITFNETSAGNFFTVLFTATDASPAASVPEPATLALLGFGLAGLGFARRRKSA